MFNRLTLLTLYLCLLCLPSQSSTVIQYGADWKYFVGTTEASSPDTTAWRLGDFDDSTWLSGPTPIGYPSDPPGNPAESSIATLLPSSSAGGYLSVFLRNKFTVT